MSPNRSEIFAGTSAEKLLANAMYPCHTSAGIRVGYLQLQLFATVICRQQWKEGRKLGRRDTDTTVKAWWMSNTKTGSFCATLRTLFMLSCAHYFLNRIATNRVFPNWIPFHTICTICAILFLVIFIFRITKNSILQNL